VRHADAMRFHGVALAVVVVADVACGEEHNKRDDSRISIPPSYKHE
jgi:hypothetical protein